MSTLQYSPIVEPSSPLNCSLLEPILGPCNPDRGREAGHWISSSTQKKPHTLQRRKQMGEKHNKSTTTGGGRGVSKALGFMEDEDQSQMKVAIAKTDLFDTQESRTSLDAGSHRHFEAHAERNENGADPQARDLADGPREGDHGPEIDSAASWRQALEREIESTDACGRREGCRPVTVKNPSWTPLVPPRSLLVRSEWVCRSCKMLMYALQY